MRKARKSKRSLKGRLDKQVKDFATKVVKRVKELGLDKLPEPSIDQELFNVTDVTKLSDQDIGRVYYAAQQMCAYVLDCAAKLDIETIFAGHKKDRAYSLALLNADGSSADDRKAEAEIDALHRFWNEVYLERRGAYKLLQASAQAYEKLADGLSREISRRKIAWDQSKGD